MGYATLYGELCLNPPIRGSIAYKWLVKIAEEESLNPPIRGSIVAPLIEKVIDKFVSIPL